MFTKLNPYTLLISLALIAGLVGYHYFTVNSLKGEIADRDTKISDKDQEIGELKLSISTQNDAVTKLEVDKKDLELQIEKFNGQSLERQKIVNKLIDELNKKKIPTDCNGATREAGKFFNDKAKSWNQK